VGLRGVHRERNDLQAARQYLQRSKEQGEHTGLPQNPYRWCAALARIREAEGDLDGALDLLSEAERLYVGDFSPNVRPVAASKVRVWIVQDRLEEALAWVNEQHLTAQDSLSYLREFEHITLARFLLARYRCDPAVSTLREVSELLDRLLKEAQAGGRSGSTIEILLLQALAFHAQGELSAALQPLRQALILAQPEGFVRMFVDEGQAMRQLLLEAAAREILPGYTGKLLAAFAAERPPTLAPLPLPPAVTIPANLKRRAGDTPLSAHSQPLVEPLSQRELEILRLFKTELSGPEIAQELVIALSTVRTHTKSIFSKLDVNNRRAAVQRAAELGLI
jgi:LuxR family transcriptional regulator, maltose regulon positive regulatory protein